MHVGRKVIDVDVELDVERGLDLPLVDLRRARIFDRQVLDILREYGNARLASGLGGAVAAGGRILVRH